MAKIRILAKVPIKSQEEFDLVEEYQNVSTSAHDFVEIINSFAIELENFWQYPEDKDLAKDLQGIAEQLKPALDIIDSVFQSISPEQAQQLSSYLHNANHPQRG